MVCISVKEENMGKGLKISMCTNKQEGKGKEWGQIPINPCTQKPASDPCLPCKKQGNDQSGPARTVVQMEHQPGPVAKSLSFQLEYQLTSGTAWGRTGEKQLKLQSEIAQRVGIFHFHHYL